MLSIGLNMQDDGEVGSRGSDREYHQFWRAKQKYMYFIK